VWTYEKGADDPQLLPIKIVAQRKRLYGDIEDFLTKDVESPAHSALKKIRNREAISGSDKMALSRYIFVFWKRVEAAYERVKEKAPEIARDEMAKLRECLRKLEEENPDKSERCNEISKDAQRIFTDLARNPSLEIWANSLQHSNERMPEVLSKMTWVFYIFKHPDIYITSDNPVFIHRAIGIGKPYSDLSFPVSKDVSLLASWQKRSDLQYQEATPPQIEELNRRMAFNSMRFAYGPLNKECIAYLLNKPKHEVHLWVQQFPGG
jgi:hypothetical protein